VVDRKGKGHDLPNQGKARGKYEAQERKSNIRRLPRKSEWDEEVLGNANRIKGRVLEKKKKNATKQARLRGGRGSPQGAIPYRGEGDQFTAVVFPSPQGHVVAAQ